MIEKYEKLFERHQQKYYPEVSDFFKKADLLYVEADIKDKMLCKMDHKGNLFLKAYDLSVVVRINKSLIFKALCKEFVDIRLFGYCKDLFWRNAEGSLKAVYKYLMNCLL